MGGLGFEVALINLDRGEHAMQVLPQWAAVVVLGRLGVRGRGGGRLTLTLAPTPTLTLTLTLTLTVGSSCASSVALPPPSRPSVDSSVGAEGGATRSKSAVESTGSLATACGSSGSGSDHG